MTIRLAVIFILMSMVQVIPPLPGQKAGTTGKGGAQVQKNRQADKPSATNPAAAINPVKPQDSDTKGAQITPKNPEYNVKLTGVPPVTVIDKEKSFLDHIFDWGPWVFNALLVAVGIIGSYLAIRTLRAVETQAALQVRSIDLQERTMQQWVDYGNWRSDCRLDTTGVRWLAVDFDLMNQTAFPITLPDCRIVFSLSGVPTTVLLRENCRLLPNKPNPVNVFFRIDEQQAAQFSGGGILVRVAGDLGYLGSLGKPSEQHLSGALWCSSKGTRFEEETPQKNRPNQISFPSQNPN